MPGAYRRPRSLACRARHAPCVLDLLGHGRHLAAVSDAGSLRCPLSARPRWCAPTASSSSGAGGSFASRTGGSRCRAASSCAPLAYWLCALAAILALSRLPLAGAAIAAAADLAAPGRGCRSPPPGRSRAGRSTGALLTAPCSALALWRLRPRAAWPACAAARPRAASWRRSTASSWPRPQCRRLPAGQGSRGRRGCCFATRYEVALGAASASGTGRRPQAALAAARPLAPAPGRRSRPAQGQDARDPRRADGDLRGAVE